MADEPDPADLRPDELSEPRGLKARSKIQAQHRTHPRTWFRWFFEKLIFPSPFRLLELGCGTGDLWLENLERLPGYGRIVLSDYSPGMVQEARQGLNGRVNVDLFACDAQLLPFPNGQFDLVVGAGLLDLVADPGQALREIHRVLKSGSDFYTSAGGRSHLLELEALARPFLPEAAFGGEPGAFGLDNGEEILKDWFPDVIRLNYSGDLVFEQADPLIEYILSERDARREIKGERLAGLRQSLEAILIDSRQIRVKVEKGVFKARKQEDSRVFR